MANIPDRNIETEITAEAETNTVTETEANTETETETNTETDTNDTPDSEWAIALSTMVPCELPKEQKRYKLVLTQRKISENGFVINIPEGCVYTFYCSFCFRNIGENMEFMSRWDIEGNKYFEYQFLHGCTKQHLIGALAQKFYRNILPVIAKVPTLFAFSMKKVIMCMLDEKKHSSHDLPLDLPDEIKVIIDYIMPHVDQLEPKPATTSETCNKPTIDTVQTDNIQKIND